MKRAQSIRLFTVIATLSVACVGVSGVAGAKGHHHHGAGKGGPSAPITVQVDPNPMVETGQSYVAGVVQVETSPAYAGDDVEIDSSQLVSSCEPGDAGFYSELSGGTTQLVTPLDNEGNATVFVDGYDCAPGTDLVDASLAVAPYYTATVELTVLPPAVTTSGVSGFPTTSGTVTGGEVETGDSGAAASAVYAIFYVETDPVYAEQTVEVESTQLTDRCGGDTDWESFTNGSTSLTGTTAIVDDDGNAVFFFDGTSCAAGSSVVTADVEAGTHPTYTTTFNILPPQVTI
jgi:hypothetical protein